MDYEDDNLIDQLQERVRKKAMESEKRDMEERAMESLSDRLGCGVSKITSKNAKDPIGENMRCVVSGELSTQRNDQLQQLISEGTTAYIKEGISKQLDEKIDGYVQKETKKQTIKMARDLGMIDEK